MGINIDTMQSVANQIMQFLTSIYDLITLYAAFKDFVTVVFKQNNSTLLNFNVSIVTIISTIQLNYVMRQLPVA